MTKTTIFGETKFERKARKAREKADLPSIAASNPKSKTLLTPKRYVVCLKWGNKYSAEYVNKLYNMIKRNLTIDYEFVCFTENSNGIDKHIRIEPLPDLPVKGWWYKPWFLSNNLPIHGTLLFLDLDLIVFNNIDQLFEYKHSADFVIIRDFNRQTQPNWDKMNSSVFRVNTGSQKSVYDAFGADSFIVTRKFQGDQDFMYKYIKKYEFWPDEWIQSYKWEMRSKDKLSIINGKRNFRTPDDPTIMPDTKIAVFHGQPDIPDCVDEWPRKNWY